MKATILHNDREFLEQALKFYKNIDKYSTALEVNCNDLGAFKNDVNILLFISSKRNHSFSESFIRYNIKLLRTRLEHLFSACINNKNYNKKIGVELGIVMPWYHAMFPSKPDAISIPGNLLSSHTGNG